MKKISYPIKCSNCNYEYPEKESFEIETLVELIHIKDFDDFNSEEEVIAHIKENEDYIIGIDTGIKCPNCDSGTFIVDEDD